MINLDWRSAIRQKAKGTTDAAFWNAAADAIERKDAAIAELVGALKRFAVIKVNCAEEIVPNGYSPPRDWREDIECARTLIAKYDIPKDGL